MRELVLAVLLFTIVAFGGFLYRNAMEMSAKHEQERNAPVVLLEQTIPTAMDLASTTATSTASTTR